MLHTSPQAALSAEAAALIRGAAFDLDGLLVNTEELYPARRHRTAGAARPHVRGGTSAFPPGRGGHAVRACFVYARMAVLARGAGDPLPDALSPRPGRCWAWVACAERRPRRRRLPRGPAFAVGISRGCVVATLAATFVIPMLDQMMADRRMYVPLAAVAAAVVVVRGRSRWSARSAERADAPRSLGHPAVACTAVGGLALAAVLAVVARQRAELFRSPVGLWHDIVRHQPDNFTARYNLATLLATAGRRDEALPHFLHAVSLEPVSPRHRSRHARGPPSTSPCSGAGRRRGRGHRPVPSARSNSPQSSPRPATTSRSPSRTPAARRRCWLPTGRPSSRPRTAPRPIRTSPSCSPPAANRWLRSGISKGPSTSLRRSTRGPTWRRCTGLSAACADALAMAEAGLREPRPEGSEGLVACLESIVAACRDRPPPAE